MRCLVSILFILLLMTGMSSCRRTAAPVHYEVPVEAEDSLDADTLPEESSEMRELEASLNLDRVFDDFMYAFVRSPRLQRERVHYPLPVVTADSLQDTLVRYLDCASEFGFMMGDFYTLLFSHPSQMEESKSADEETVRVERINLHEMQVRSFDFERRHGKWMLIGLEDKGVGQSDCADFLEFYAHFSTDSLFQSRHLARRLRFSMLDPEDDNIYVEGTITAQQWFSFCPDVPSGIISNVRYGQTFLPDHMVLQKCGIANGMQETFTFDQKGGRWLLTSYEN